MEIVKYVKGVRNVKSVKRSLWDPFETTLISLRGYSGSLWDYFGIARSGMTLGSFWLLASLCRDFGKSLGRFSGSSWPQKDA